MPDIQLKKLVRSKEITALITNYANLGKTVTIYDKNNMLLAGTQDAGYNTTCELKHNNTIIGFLKGDETVATFAPLMQSILIKEAEKRLIVQETLERYKEINLLYTFSEKATECLDILQISKLVIEEALKIINATSASVMLFNKESGNLEVIAATGFEFNKKFIFKPGDGIAGQVFQTKKAEIINNVSIDPRFVKGREIQALICAPLKNKDKVLGVINVSNKNPGQYTSGDLKLLTTLALQAAAFIENAMLYENKIKQEKERLHLERYVAPQVVEAIMRDTDNIGLAPGKKRITVMFSDIRNFTGACEMLEPEQIVKYLNEYFSSLVEIIFKNNGTLNKFVGDMIVALFGAPAEVENHEIVAIESAIQMQQCIKTMKTLWIKDNFHTGIGINSGHMVVGNIGSTHHTDYTAIGDEVNIASRLQTLAKGSQILVSRNTYDAAKNVFEFKELGGTSVKGKNKPVEVFEVIY
ncbi:MAG: adenylate/guanylate cyclase domain-containing protein [Elusimicrobiota bacterium]